MTARTAATSTREIGSFQTLNVPVAANFVGYKNTFAAFLGGYLVPAETALANNHCRLLDDVDNTGGANGDLTVDVIFNELKKTSLVDNDTVAPVLQVNLYGAAVGAYWKDNYTVSADDAGGTRPEVLAWEIETTTPMSLRQGVRVELL